MVSYFKMVSSLFVYEIKTYNFNAMHYTYLYNCKKK